jgi:hypothetical protein
MLIAKLLDLQPVEHTSAFPNTSFADIGPNDAFLAEHGYAKVNLWKPHDPATQRLMSTAPYFEDGWVYTVAVVDKTQDDLAQEEMAQAAAVRAERNQRLAACDWTQLADAPVSSFQWANYRQALRDVPSQVGFPWTVVWPTPPV